MTDVWLGIIAVSTLVMAAIQVGVILYGARVASRLQETMQRIERDLGPILARFQEVSADAARMSAIAAAQVERVDQLFGDLARRVDQTAAIIQQSLVTPVREGAALLSALRSAFAALRGLRSGRTGPSHAVEEDDALFIG